MTSLRTFEARFVRPNVGRTLIVGSFVAEGKEDRRHRYPDAAGIDMRDGPGVDIILDLEEPLPEGLGQFSHVDCLSVLEHSRRPWLMATNIERLMWSGASLFIAAPFVWRPHNYPDDYYRFTVNGVKALFSQIEWSSAAWASNRLAADGRIPHTSVNGHPYAARTEVCLFGHKR